MRFLLKIPIILLFLFFLIFIQSLASNSGKIYYVSPKGSNSNPGTFEKPWKTPGFASRKLKPGDTLIILGGKYILGEYDADIIKPPSGKEKAWITIKGEEGNRPVLAGRNNLLTAIDLSGVSYVKIENLEITHDNTATGEDLWFRDGIEILWKPSSYIILKDLYIHHIDEFGINIQDVDNLQIINCRIEYCGFGAIGGPAGEHGGWKNVKIEKCRLSYSGHYYQGGNGSERPYERPDGFGIEPSEGPVEIVDTIAEHNYGDGLDSKAEKTYICRCIVANNTCDGVKLWGDGSRVENTLIYGRGDGSDEETPWGSIVIDQVEKKNAKFEIVNSTIDSAVVGSLMYIQITAPYKEIPIKIILRNTIFCGREKDNTIDIGDSVDLILENNLFYAPKSNYVLSYKGIYYTSKTIETFGKGNIYGNPLFISPAWGTLGDYHLKDNSPAIDKGASTGAPDHDLEKNLRPKGKGYDMGCYER
ncbi:MAG: right-handed parallel beta-helix repeat-containing protein [Dictyoglomaceae bacterium]|nr:right-handed parallel beta-helix repeat-containing protein [Dictyoglomaceae bacterium]